MSESNGDNSAPVEASAPVESEANVESNVADESVDQSIDEGAQAQEAAAQAAQAQKMLKKFKLKSYGQEIEKEIDLNNEDEIRQELQLAAAARKSMSEAAEVRKAYAKFIQEAKQNPWQIFEELGMNPDELAELRLQQRIEEMKKSPEQLEKERIQKELEEARLVAQKLKEEKEQMEMSKLQEQALGTLKSEISNALSAHKTLPNSPYVEKKVADTMLWAMNNGFTDVSAHDVLPLVEKEIRDEMNKFMDVLPEEFMEGYIGKQNIERLRKRRIGQSKVPSLNDVKPTTQAVKAAQADSKSDDKKNPVKSKDFFRTLGK